MEYDNLLADCSSAMNVNVIREILKVASLPGLNNFLVIFPSFPG
jgi:hypothetical protein